MTVRKIRIGNTISFPWQITRGGEIEDLSVVTNMKLMRYIGKIGREGIEVPVSLIDSNTLRVVAPTDTTNKLGDYIYELTYYRTGASVPPAERECALDITAFTLVSRTAYADPDDEFTLTSDLIIGLIGAKFESKDFTSEEWVEIQRPAIEAAQLASEAATRAVVATEEAGGGGSVYNSRERAPRDGCVQAGRRRCSRERHRRSCRGKHTGRVCQDAGR